MEEACASGHHSTVDLCANIFVTTTIFVMFGGLNHFVTVVIENIKKDIEEIHCIRMIVLAVSFRWDSYWFDILAANKERISRAWNLE